MLHYGLFVVLLWLGLQIYSEFQNKSVLKLLRTSVQPIGVSASKASHNVNDRNATTENGSVTQDEEKIGHRIPCHSAGNCHLIVLEGFARPSDPGSCVVGSISPW